ncbi:MAG TPA: tyrosinase family protein [Xanthobacteraceae bacterium]|jgi:tyrosinase
MAVRNNVSSLSTAERDRLVKGVKLLKAAPSRFTPPTAGRYDDYVYVHMQAMLVMEIEDRAKPVRNGNWKLISDMRMPMWAHRCPAFLPWHREFLHQIELDLQAVLRDPNIGIPYWDWSVDHSRSKLPWTTDLLGGDGRDGPVQSGPFAGKTNWELTLSEDGVDHLVRGFGLDHQAGARLPSKAEEQATLQIAKYDASPWSDNAALATFRNQLEGWHVPAGSPMPVGMHNRVHVWVGGTKGTMLPSTSPNDPAFFLHHCNIDRLWAVWQRSHPAGPLYLPARPLPGEPGQSLNEPMIFYDTTLSTTPPWTDPPATPIGMLDHHKLRYTYDTDPPVHDIEGGIMATTELSRQPARIQELATDPLKRKAFRIAPRDRFRKRLEQLEQVSPAGPSS